MAGIALLLPAVAAGQERRPLTITASQLEVDRRQHIATYTGDVVAVDRNKDLAIRANQMDFFFDERMEEIRRAVATGNVQIRYGDRRGEAERAEYIPGEDRAVLTGRPKVWQENDLVTGSRITLFLREDRSVVEGDGSQPVNVILYPRGEGRRPAPAAPGRGGPRVPPGGPSP